MLVLLLHQLRICLILTFPHTTSCELGPLSTWSMRRGLGGHDDWVLDQLVLLHWLTPILFFKFSLVSVSILTKVKRLFPGNLNRSTISYYSPSNSRSVFTRMSSFLDTLEACYSTRDLYEVLGVDKSAKEGELRRAYLRLSLKVHPDRVTPDQVDEATNKFQVSSKAIYVCMYVRYPLHSLIVLFAIGSYTHIHSAWGLIVEILKCHPPHVLNVRSLTWC